MEAFLWFCAGFLTWVRSDVLRRCWDFLLKMCAHIKLDINFLCPLEPKYWIRRILVVLLAELLELVLMFVSDVTHFITQIALQTAFLYNFKAFLLPSISLCVNKNKSVASSLKSF